MAPGDEGLAAFQRDGPGECLEGRVGIRDARFLLELEGARLGDANVQQAISNATSVFMRPAPSGVYPLIDCKPCASARFRESRSPAGDGN